MTRKEYIREHLVEIEDPFLISTTKNLKDKSKGRATILIDKQSQCYVTMPSLLKQDDDVDDFIRFLAHHEINHLFHYPYKSNRDHPAANIGYSDKEKLWYAWNYYTTVSYGIGSIVDDNDIAYIPSSREDQERHTLELLKKKDIDRDYAITDRNETSFIVSNGEFNQKYDYLSSFGKGTWKAKDYADARIMACDAALNL